MKSDTGAVPSSSNIEAGNILRVVYQLFRKTQERERGCVSKLCAVPKAVEVDTSVCFEAQGLVKYIYIYFLYKQTGIAKTVADWFSLISLNLAAIF